MAEYVGHDVVEGIRDLLPVLRDRAQETEDARVVPAESVKSLAETGFFRLLQPASFGGLEADPLTFYTAVRLIASACGSTGWACSVLGVHPWHVGLFPPQVQQEVWGDDPATRISSSYAPTGRALRVEGGHQVSGRWSFSSGCDHATWVLLGQIVTDDDNRPVDFRTFLLPRAEYAIEDVWDTVGLRGTGSNDIVVGDIFVPEYRSLSFMDVSRLVVPGQALNPAPLYRLPYGSVFSYGITAPIIGMATGAYEAHVTYLRERVRVAYAGQKAAQDPFAQVRVAEAAAEIDSAWLALERNMTDLMGYARAGAAHPARGPAAGTARPGPRDRPVDPRGRPAVREFGRPRAEIRDADPAVLARRARGPGARHQRPGAGAVDVRRRRVRPARASRRDAVIRLIPAGRR